MSESFNYIDAPIEYLDRRGRELTWSINNINHCPERKAQIQSELSHIALELWCKHRDGDVEFVDV